MFPIFSLTSHNCFFLFFSFLKIFSFFPTSVCPLCVLAFLWSESFSFSFYLFRFWLLFSKRRGGELVQEGRFKMRFIVLFNPKPSIKMIVVHLGRRGSQNRIMLRHAMSVIKRLRRRFGSDVLVRMRLLHLVSSDISSSIMADNYDRWCEIRMVGLVSALFSVVLQRPGYKQYSSKHAHARTHATRATSHMNSHDKIHG